jgi:hypothetical protein
MDDEAFGTKKKNPPKLWEEDAIPIKPLGTRISLATAKSKWERLQASGNENQT